MKLQVSINKRNRKTFDSFLNSILTLSYQIDVFSNHSGNRSRYEIPFENDNQKRTILEIMKLLK